MGDKELDYWFTSDTHWGHQNIIDYENRPFQTVEDMDEALIENWNACVKPGDTVYHLGDVFFRKNTPTMKAIMDRLNGDKILRMGNHDRESVTKYLHLGFQKVYKQDLIVSKFAKPMILSHYPVEDELTLNSFKARNVHGHTHSQNGYLDQYYFKCVSVELTNYRPLHVDEINKWLI